MPDVSSGSIFPKTICSVELGQAARIGQNAFNACGQLHELTVPESVTSIGSNALVPAAGWWFLCPGIQGS